MPFNREALAELRRRTGASYRTLDANLKQIAKEHGLENLKTSEAAINNYQRGIYEPQTDFIDALHIYARQTMNLDLEFYTKPQPSKPQT